MKLVSFAHICIALTCSFVGPAHATTNAALSLGPEFHITPDLQRSFSPVAGPAASLDQVHVATMNEWSRTSFTRVSRQGELLDPIPREVEGGRWVAVLTNSATEFIFITAGSQGEVFAQTAGLDGELGRRFLIGSGFIDLSAARNRTGFLVVGTRLVGDNYFIQSIFVDNAGTVHPPKTLTPESLQPGGLLVAAPSVAATDEQEDVVRDTFLVVWQEASRGTPQNWNIGSILVDGAGNVAPNSRRTPISSPLAEFAPVLVSAPGRYYMAFLRRAEDGTYIANGGFLDTKGESAGEFPALGLEIDRSSPTQLTLEQFSPWLVLGARDHTGSRVRIHSVSGEATRESVPVGTQFHFTGSETNGLVIRSTTHEVAAALVRTGSPGTYFPINNIRPVQRMPAVAFDGTSYLTVWHTLNPSDVHSSQPPSVLSGSFNTPTGTPRSAGSIPIADVVLQPRRPFVMPFSSNRFLTVWNSGFVNYFTLLSETGPKTSPVRLSSFVAGDAHAAATGGKTLIAWGDNATDTSDISGAIVGEDGLVERRFVIETKPGVQTSPVVAATPGQFLVAWLAENSRGWADVCVRGISPDGQLLGTDSVTVATNIVSWRSSSLAITANGTNYLLAWPAWNYPTDPTIELAEINPALQSINRVSIFRSRTYPYDAAWTGSEYLVTTQTERGFFQGAGNIAMRLKPGASTAEVFVVSTNGNSMRVTRGPKNQALFVYELDNTIRARRYIPDPEPLRIEAMAVLFETPRLDWIAQVGAVYVIEGRESLTSGAWTEVARVTADRVTQSWRGAPLTSSAKFYRVRLLSLPTQ